MGSNTSPSFFASRGKVIIPVGNSTDYAYGLIQQPDGRLVLAGASYDSSTNWNHSAVRLNADGSPDASFGSGGKAIIPVTSSYDQAYSLIRQADGKLVLAGYSRGESNDDYCVVRLNADGTLDGSFGDGGKAVIPVGSAADTARSVIQQTNGQLVLAGYSNNDFSIIRLNADGSLDSGFGTNGAVIIPVGSSWDFAYSVIQQASGQLVLAGYSQGSNGYDFSIVRLNANGSLDSGFGSGGKAIIPVGSLWDYAYSVIQQTDGKLVVAGGSYGSSGNDDYSIVRLNADGSLDSSFGSNGKAIIPVGSHADTAYSVIQQVDGKLVLAGVSYNGRYDDYSVVRLNGDGSLDSGFGSGGKVIVPMGSTGNIVSRVIQQADGKLVLAGASNNGSDYDYSIVRLNADGSLDATFTGASSLDGVASFTEGGPPVRLDASVVLGDAELAALNSGAGNYDGASITLARAGGAVAEDVFSGSGNLSFSGGSVVLSGTTVGSLNQANGTLTIWFGSNATQARINETLSSIAYANTSATPPASVQIAWAFSDGNTGSQGTGGAGSTSGSTTVNITAVDSNIQGTSGPDLLNGTPDADTQSGLDGNDTLLSSAGNDSLDGGAGTDTADFSQETAPVSVILYGHQSHGLSIGVDTLTAIENIVGSQFNDLVYGDLGNNLIQGGLGQDTLDGAEGNDTLQGQTGDDLLNGLAGNDSLEGGEGNDSIYGWADLDTLVGGLGDDRLFGGAQADVLDGGDGADNLEGDDGNDTLTGAVGNDTLRGWNDNDSMDGGDGDDALFGGAGADVMLGGVGTDNLEGDDGNDTIAGGTGNDTLRGWNDNDSLDGSDGNDLVVGWSGNDSLVGGLGDDSLFGDDGADTLVGGAGGDVLQGGLGNDLYTFATGFGFDGVKDYDYTAGNSDTFQFNGVNLAELSFARVGDALKVERTASAGADVIYVNDWYMAGSNGAYKIESWIMGDGTYTAAQIEALVA